METQLLDEQMIEQISQSFKALSDPTRIKILHLLLQKEHAVNEISEALDMNQSTISHQLSYLKQLHLVKRRREKTLSYYSPNDHHVMNLLEQSIEHASHTYLGRIHHGPSSRS